MHSDFPVFFVCRKPFPVSDWCTCCPTYFSGSYLILFFTFRSFIHREFIHVGCQVGFNFIFQMLSQLSSCHLLNKPLFQGYVIFSDCFLLDPVYFTFSKARFVDLIYVKYNFFFSTAQLFLMVAVVVNVCSFVATTDTSQDLEHFHRPPKGSLLPLCSQPPHRWLYTFATSDLFSIPKIFAFSRMSCEWNHQTHRFLGLAYFTQHSAFRSHPCCRVCQQFIPSHCWAAFCDTSVPWFT